MSHLSDTINSEIKKVCRRTGMSANDVAKTGLSLSGSLFFMKDLPSYIARKTGDLQALTRDMPGNTLSWLKNATQRFQSPTAGSFSEKPDPIFASLMKEVCGKSVEIVHFEHLKAPSLWLIRLTATGLYVDKNNKTFQLDETKLNARGYGKSLLSQDELISKCKSVMDTLTNGDDIISLQAHAHSLILPQIKILDKLRQLDVFIQKASQLQNIRNKPASPS